MIAKKYLEFSSECYCWLVWDRVNNNFLISMYCFQSRYEPMKAIFLVAQGLCCCTRAFSSCNQQPTLWFLCAGLSCRSAQTRAHGLQQVWCAGFVAPQHVVSSQTRERACVPCTGRQILSAVPQGIPRVYF